MEKKKEKVKKKEIKLKLEPIQKSRLSVVVTGKALITDRFPERAEQEILAKQTGLAKSSKKKVRDMETEMKDAIHVTSKGKVGFPASAFKKGMMNCTSFVGDKFFSRKLVQGAVRIVNAEEGLLLLKYRKKGVIKRNIGGKIKFNPVFYDWSCEIIFEYDNNNFSAHDIITLLNYAGFYSGVGAWRPKGRDGGSGDFGTYEVKRKK